MNEWLTLLLRGYSILTVAILANMIANKLGITTWFDFIKTLRISELDMISLIFLFLVYPFLLALAYTLPEMIK